MSVVGPSSQMSLRSGGAGLHQQVVSVVPKEHPGPQGPGLDGGGQDTVKGEVIRAVALTGYTLSIFMPGLHFRPTDQNVCGRSQKITMLTLSSKVENHWPGTFAGTSQCHGCPKACVSTCRVYWSGKELS